MSNEIQRQTDQKEAKISSLANLPYTCSGSHISVVYKRVYDKELDMNVVKKVDTFNLYEFIQASRATTDLAILQKRYLELGEIPNVDPSAGSVDFTLLPSNIHEVYDLVNDVEANFNKLPKSIQDVFGNSQAYMQSLLNGTYQATLLNALKNSEQPKEEVKKEGE